MFSRIKDVVIKTLISVEPHVVNAMSRNTKHRNVCFEVYGFDIMLDSKLKPWLIEVNIAPSLSSSSPLDKTVKTMLICDTLNLVGVQLYDRKQYEKEAEILLKKKLMGLERQSHTQAGKKYQSMYLEEDEEKQICYDFEEEQQRTSNFELIFPLPN